MNIANLCKGLVLIGAFTFGFGAKSGGTIPIPGSAQIVLPLTLGGKAELSGVKEDLVIKVDEYGQGTIPIPGLGARAPMTAAELKAECIRLGTAVGTPASGSIEIGDNKSYRVEGICSKPSSSDRTIVGTAPGTNVAFKGKFAFDADAKIVTFVGDEASETFPGLIVAETGEPKVEVWGEFEAEGHGNPKD